MKKITLNDYLKRELAPQTAKSYQYAVNNFLTLHPKAKRYKYQQLVKYMAEVTENYPNTQTRIRILSALKRYYDYLVDTGQRQDHPCQRLTIKRPINQNIQFQDLFTIGELELLLKRENRYRLLESRNKVLISLLIYQGLTSDEVIRLDVDNINLDEGTVYVKGSHKLNRRGLPLYPNQIMVFSTYINETHPKLLRCTSSKLILNKLGHPITVDGVNAVIEPLQGLFPDRNLNPRTIRMSVIANWINERKYSLEKVQELAGHQCCGDKNCPTFSLSPSATKSMDEGRKEIFGKLKKVKPDFNLSMY